MEEQKRRMQREIMSRLKVIYVIFIVIIVLTVSGKTNITKSIVILVYTFANHFSTKVA